MTAFWLFPLVFVLLYIRSSYRRRHFPPGPRGLPVIGNLHQIPAHKPWKQLKQWHDQYGPVVSIQVGRRTMIILGTYQAARELLEKRSKNYSSRPAIFSQLASNAPHTLFLPSGPQWRAHRRIFASFLSAGATERYRPLQDLESKQVMHELFSSHDFAGRFHRYSASLAFSLAYGKRVLTGAESDVREIERIVRELFATAMNPVAAFPILRHLPEFLAPWDKASRLLHQAQQRLFVKTTAAALRTRSWNWTVAAAGTKEAQKMDPAERAWVTGITFEAASDTTTLSLEFVVRACVVYPQAMRRVQTELDAVVGGGGGGGGGEGADLQMPHWDHLARLPYLHAFIREVYRMFPTSPAFGVFHTAQEADEYMGYTIPRGAAVVTNNHSLGFDAATFADPWTFRPERWIENPQLPSANFGYGRRICPGHHLAHNSIHVVTARLLWGYDITPVVADDQTLDPFDVTDGLLSRPSPFQACFSPRSARHRAVIEQEWQQCDKDIDVLLQRIGDIASSS